MTSDVLIGTLVIKVKMLEKQFEDIERSFICFKQDLDSYLGNLGNRDNKKPFTCPVCEGLGKKQIYHANSHSSLLEKGLSIDAEGRSYQFCSPCEGKGIVWG